ncbi:MAG: ABC-2 family transporter protein [Myxococcaceae bacterium]
MSQVATAIRALPTLFKVGFAEAVAYRAEMFVWVFSTTMPLIMIMVWTSIAAVSPMKNDDGSPWDVHTFTAYFLSVFIVRQLISAWASWEINFEVRRGNLAMRLLRPMHPVISYATSNLAYLPLRLIVTLPVLVVLLVFELEHLSKSPLAWVQCCVALAGAWGINFFVNVAVGALSFFFESSLKFMELWLASFFVFSGYLFPLGMQKFSFLRSVNDWLPFRFLITLPVELMTGRLEPGPAWELIGRQFLWVGALMVVALLVWNRGVRRFQSFGG